MILNDALSLSLVCLTQVTSASEIEAVLNPFSLVLPLLVVQVERLVAKLQQLRQDANQAEERAAQVSEEAKQLAHALEERRANLDSRAQNLVMSRNKVDKLAQVGNLFLASLCLHFTSEVILGTEKSLSVVKSLPFHGLNRSCPFTLPVKVVVGIENPIIVLQVSESPQSVYNLSIQAVEIG